MYMLTPLYNFLHPCHLQLARTPKFLTHRPANDSISVCYYYVYYVYSVATLMPLFLGKSDLVAGMNKH